MGTLKARPEVGAKRLAFGQSLAPSGGTVSRRHLPLVPTRRKRSSVGFVTSGPSGTVRVRNVAPGGGVTFQPTWIPWMPSS